MENQQIQDNKPEISGTRITTIDIVKEMKKAYNEEK